MHYFKQYGCLALLVLLTITAHAQQPVSLKTLLSNIDQKAPVLLTDSAAIAIKQAQAIETRNNWLPNLKLSYQADVGSNNNTPGPYFSFGMVPSNSGGIRAASNTDAALVNLGIVAADWEVYNFGAYTAQIKVANSDVSVEQNRYQQSKFQLQAYTIGNYLQLLRLQGFLAIQSRNIQRDQEIGRSIRSLAISGIRQGVDTSIAAAELSKARLNYIELNNQLKQVQLQLSAVSGLPYQSIVPDTLAANRLADQANIAAIPGIDTANHPLINYYRSVLDNSMQKEDLVKKQYNPRIMLEAAAWGRGASVDAGSNFNSLDKGWGFSRDNYVVGLGITYNLFDLRRKTLKLHTQKTVTDYARLQLDEQKNALALSVNQAGEELNTAKQRLQEIPNQLNAANAGYRQKLSLYKSGLTDIIDLNAALNILYRAENDYVQAKYAFMAALFQKAIAGNQVNTTLNLLK